MPLSIIIDAPVKEVFDVLNTSELNTIWNPVTDSVKSIGTTNRSEVESFLGNFNTSKATTPAPNLSVTLTIEDPDIVLRELKYELVKLSDTQTRVDGTVKFAGSAHYTTVHRVVGKKLIQNLKRFVEHIHAGLAAADFNKEI